MDSPLQILDFLGIPIFGGALYIDCVWRIDETLATAADSNSIQLSSRILDGNGSVVISDGPRSLEVAPEAGESNVQLRIDLPQDAGRFTIEVEPLVEHRFWGSRIGIWPVVLEVERSMDFSLVAIDPITGRRFEVPVPKRRGRTVSLIEHLLYGKGDSERAIEIPWVLSRYRTEKRVLDVGFARSEARYRRALRELQLPFAVGLDLIECWRASAARGIGDLKVYGIRS